MVVGEVLAVHLAERELEDLHAGQAERREELAHVVRDLPEVLGDDRDVAERVPDREKEHEAGPRLPAPLARRGRARGDRPVAREGAEVVEADEVGEAEVRADTLDPPVERLRFEDVPAVQRMAPELPVLAEGVGRDARDELGPAGGIDGEEPPLRPDVGAVERDVDREVAHDRDPACVRGALDPLPLPVKEELRERVVRDLLRVGRAGRGERAVVPRRERRLPLRPRGAAVCLAQRGEEGPVGEPGGVRRGGREARDGVRDARADRARVREGRAQDARLERAHGFEVHAVLRKVRRSLEGGGREQPLLEEPLGRDEKRVAGERGESRVRRVVGAGRDEREDLPEPQAGRRRPVEKHVARGPEIADPEAGREGRRVEEEPRLTDRSRHVPAC